MITCLICYSKVTCQRKQVTVRCVRHDQANSAKELSFSFFSILKGERLRHYFNHIVANEEQNVAAMWESNEWATIFIKKIVSEACKFSVETKIRKAKNRIQLKLEHCKISFCGKYACRRYSGV